MKKNIPEKEQPKSAWIEHPDYQIQIAPCEQRIKATFNGESIAESNNVLLVQEQNHEPVYYFPMDEVCMEFLQPSTKITFCPYKGNASHWSLNIKDRAVEPAAWCYESPFDEVAKIKGYIAFYPSIVTSSVLAKFSGG